MDHTQEAMQWLALFLMISLPPLAIGAAIEAYLTRRARKWLEHTQAVAACRAEQRKGLQS